MLRRLKILHAVAHLLGFQLTYMVRFVPITGKRSDLRGRRIGDPITNPSEAVGFLHGVKLNPKEKTHGSYLLVAEAVADGFFHDPLVGERPSEVHGGLPQAAQGGPAAAAPEEAADDEAQGAAGAGADGGHAAGTEAAAESGQPVGTVGPLGPPDERLLQSAIAHASLDQLGER